MSIQALENDTLEQKCNACEHIRCFKYKDIQSASDDEHTGIIVLPACVKCGAIEYLIPTTIYDEPHPTIGSYGHRHQIMVDVLHERLVKKKQLKRIKRIAKAPNKKEIAKYFPGKTLRLQEDIMEEHDE